jgi:hypothetical protein
MVLTANLAICLIKASGKSSRISSINNSKGALLIISFNFNLKNSRVTKLLGWEILLLFIIIYKIEIQAFRMGSSHLDLGQTYKKKVFHK